MKRTLRDKIDESLKINSNKCFIWTNNKTSKNGYGRVKIDGKSKVVTIYVLEQILGRPLLPKHLALHHCDNPACYNWQHLYEGTHRQNMDDMIHRGRQNKLKGIESGNTKLKEEDISLIHELRNQGLSYGQIAENINISKNNVCRIIHGEAWKHINKPKPIEKQNIMGLKGEKNITSKLKEAQVKEIVEIYYEGNRSYSELAKIYNTTKSNISNIILNKSWQHLERPNYLPKKQNNKGERNSKTKLKESQVIEILNLKASKSLREIAEIYHVSHASIYSIFSGKNWSHITKL